MNYGQTNWIKFVNFRERAFYISVRGIFFALRFSYYDAGKAAEWAVVVWRVLRYQGSDNDMQEEKFIGTVGREFPIEL